MDGISMLLVVAARASVCRRIVSAKRAAYTTVSGIARELIAKSSSLLGTILLIVLVLLLIGALPHWPYSSSWGYYPSGGLGLVLLIIVILLVLKYI